jgi:hypothetical protein
MEQTLYIIIFSQAKKWNPTISYLDVLFLRCENEVLNHMSNSSGSSDLVGSGRRPRCPIGETSHRNLHAESPTPDENRKITRSLCALRDIEVLKT